MEEHKDKVEQLQFGYDIVDRHVNKAYEVETEDYKEKAVEVCRAKEELIVETSKVVVKITKKDAPENEASTADNPIPNEIFYDELIRRIEKQMTSQNAQNLANSIILMANQDAYTLTSEQNRRIKMALSSFTQKIYNQDFQTNSNAIVINI